MEVFMGVTVRAADITGWSPQEAAAYQSLASLNDAADLGKAARAFASTGGTERETQRLLLTFWSVLAEHAATEVLAQSGRMQVHLTERRLAEAPDVPNREPNPPPARVSAPVAPSRLSTVAQTSIGSDGSCLSCGRQWGGGIACQFCGQVEGLPSGAYLVSPGRRLLGLVLDTILAFFTLGIGWIIWSLIVWSNGQSPAKQIMGIRVVKMRTGRVAGWGTMFLRELIAKPIIGTLNWLTLGIANFWLVWDRNNQELWDKIIGSIVVDFG